MSLISDVAEYLEDQGVGTRGTDLFFSYFPDEVDTGVAIKDTGGIEPNPDIPTKHPTFQIIVRAVDYATGKTKIDNIRSLLHRTQMSELVSGNTYFMYILALQEPGHLGRNERGQDEFSVNFKAITR